MQKYVFFFFPGPPQVPHMLWWSGHTGLPIKQADFSQEIRDRLYSEGALNRATGYHRGGMSSFSISVESAWLAYFVHCRQHRKRASLSATCFEPAGRSLNYSRSFFPLNYLHSILGKPVTKAPCRCWRLSWLPLWLCAEWKDFEQKPSRLLFRHLFEHEGGVRIPLVLCCVGWLPQ